MVLQTEDAIQVYRELAKYPSVTSARVCNDRTPGHVKVHSEWTERDIERTEKVKFSRTHVVQLDVVFATPPTETNNEQWNVESPSGKLKAIVRSLKDKGGDQKQYIEIWNQTSKVQTIKVENLDQHGKIYERDGQFGSLVWNASETHLLYIAEKKKPKQKSFFDKKPLSSEKEQQDKEERGNEFLYREDWGEQLVGKVQPVVCVVDIEAGITSVLENVPEDISPGQAVWGPNDLGVVFVGWYHEAYKLGLTYCPTRKNDLFYIDLKNFQCNKLTHTDYAVRSPVFSPDFKKLIYLANNIGGPHFQCSRLMMIDWSTKGIVRVVDVVKKATGPEFPGIYTGALNHRCWSQDNRRVLLHSFWRSRQELLIVDTDTGEAKCITQDPAIGSWTLLDVCGDIVLAACASPNQLPYLVISTLPESGKELSMKWTSLDEKPEAFSDISWDIIKMDVPEERVNQKYPDLDFECFLMMPGASESTEKPPLIVFPHGGPHSLFSTDFLLYTAGFCRCGYACLKSGPHIVFATDFVLYPAACCKIGYAVLQINYRGSLGFGSDSIDSLLGTVGTQDVQDCQAAMQKVLEMGVVDENRVVVMGGSHGGFITAHLIGQFPDVYKAAVARNPVINVSSMVNCTDITDWCFEESGHPFNFKNALDPKMLEEMWSRSPIRYVDNVKTPVMLMIGEDDRRVPPKQAHEYRRALQARDKSVRLLSYPGNAHPINKVDSEADAFVNIVQWFNKHIGAE